ncbi:MAG: SgcJ/EcaC family oxidoreductase [Syntrophaceae bacterium]|nr:SgcJ/EcaC family oxidoreductase [Syntrophaceae bacterium]
MPSVAKNSVQDSEAIKRLVGPEWEAAWAAGDAAAVAGFYTKDAVILPQNQIPIVGKSAIRSSYEAFFKKYTITGGSTVVEVEVSGDWAFMRGTYVTRVTDRKGSGPTEEDRGQWLWIVKRLSDGSWKIFRAVGVSEPAYQNNE